MEKERTDGERLTGTEGVDDAALGLGAAPESSPPGAEVDATERRLPGPDFGDLDADEAKPWFTTLSAESRQAGVSNDSDAQPDPAFDEERD